MWIVRSHHQTCQHLTLYWVFFHEYLRILSQVERYSSNEMTLLLCNHPSSSVDRGKYPQSGHNYHKTIAMFCIFKSTQNSLKYLVIIRFKYLSWIVILSLLVSIPESSWKTQFYWMVDTSLIWSIITMCWLL